MNADKLLDMGYCPVRKLPNGEFIGVMRMAYTAGLFVGLDDVGYARRYCYARLHDAEQACITWDGEGDPPGPWIKEKPSDRLGPGITGDIGDVHE